MKNDKTGKVRQEDKDNGERTKKKNRIKEK